MGDNGVDVRSFKQGETFSKVEEDIPREEMATVLISASMEEDMGVLLHSVKSKVCRLS